MSDSPERHEAGAPLPPEAAALLQAARTPAQTDEVRAARVRKRLSVAVMGGYKSPRLRPRPVIVVLGATLVAGAAAAMHLRPWRHEPAAPPPHVQPEPLPAYVATAEPPEVDAASTSARPQAAAVAITPSGSPDRAKARAQPAPSRRADLAAPKAAAMDATPPAPSDAESELMLEAVRLVRRERDARRGRALAARYLQLHPTGALREEAQALQIEAAVLAHDADARTLAQDYLMQHPNGRFVAVARRALAAGRD